jgi:acetyl esterase/lipase
MPQIMTREWTEDWMESDRFGQMRFAIHHQPDEGRAMPFVLHLHGGAFTGGSIETGRTVAGLLADAGATVASFDYPIAPGNAFPNALEGAFEALQFVHHACPTLKQCRVYVAGEEAGGNLAAGLALMARDQQTPPLAGQILLSPMLDPCLGTQSIRDADAGAAGCKWADGWHCYLGSAEKAAHPYASPLGARRLVDLAPALIVTAQDDPMRDESLRYAERLRACGVTVQDRVLAAPTGWPEALQRTPEAEPRWAAYLRTLFIDFFAKTAAPLKGHGLRTQAA